MISKTQLIDGLIHFAEREMLPVLGGWQQWAAAAGLILVKQTGEQAVDMLLSNKVIKSLGVVTDTGLIDVDKAFQALRQGGRKNKLKPFPVNAGPFGEFTIRPEDLDVLYKYLSSAASEEVSDASAS